MILKRGFTFEFDPPADWKEFRDGDHFVFHGPADEELIVSGAIVVGRGASASYDRIKEQLIANAISSMRHAVNVPDVVVKGEIRELRTAHNLRAWLLDAETRDHAVVFLQAAVEAEGGVLLATLEAPYGAHARTIFERFVSGVRPALAESDPQA